MNVHFAHHVVERDSSFVCNGRVASLSCYRIKRGFVEAIVQQLQASVCEDLEFRETDCLRSQIQS